MKLVIPAMLMVALAACTTEVPLDGSTEGEGDGNSPNEGEGDPNEGEGDANPGEGEGEVDPDFTVTIATKTPFFPRVADGTSATTLRLTIINNLTGAPAADVAIDVVGDAAVRASSAQTNDQGVAIIDVVADLAGDFQLDVVGPSGTLLASPAIVVSFLACQSLPDTYAADVYPRVFQRCVGCHNDHGYGAREGAPYRLPFPGEPAWASRSVTRLQDFLSDRPANGDLAVADFPAAIRTALGIDDGDPTSLSSLFVSPVLADDMAYFHVGGRVIDAATETDAALRLASFIDRLRAPDDSCANAVSPPLVSAATQHDPATSLLLATALVTGGVPPSVVTTEAQLASSLSSLATSPAMESVLTEAWDDWLLTNVGTVSVGNSMPGENNRRIYFNPEPANPGIRSSGVVCNEALPPAGAVDFKCCHSDEDIDPNPAVRASLCSALRAQANVAVRHEPVALMLDLYRRNQPFSGVVDADFTMATPQLAEADDIVQRNNRTALVAGVGVAGNAFNNDPSDDDNEWLRVRLPHGPPHLGILSMPALMRRYTTTASNKQRGRLATIVMQRLLDVPVLRLAPLTTPDIPEGTDLEQLTQQTQPCAVCHAVIDPPAVAYTGLTGNSATMRANPRCMLGMPVGGLGYDANGNVIPFLPGEGACQLATPNGTVGTFDANAEARFVALGQRVAADPRLDVGLVVPVVLALLRQERLYPPDATDPAFDAKVLAFLEQERVIEAAVTVYRAEAKRMAPVVAHILGSDAFRFAARTVASPAESEALALLGYGGRLLAPERLHQRVIERTGFPWTDNRTEGGTPQLATNRFGILFGGVDSQTVVERSRTVLPVRANIARRLGHDMACVMVPRSFAYLDAADRPLFGLVETTDRPFDIAGVPDAEAPARIAAQVDALFSALLGISPTDAEHDAAVALFAEVVASLDAVEGDDCRVSGCADDATCGAGNGLCSLSCAVSRDFANIDIVFGQPTAARPLCGPSPTAECSDPTRGAINRDPDHTIRAWMAVVSYLLADPRFFIE